MKLYYHHVGKKGADEDFKKTVFARVPISLVENSISDNEPNKALLLSELNEKFPMIVQGIFCKLGQEDPRGTKMNSNRQRF